jgi:hypothetical protein
MSEPERGSRGVGFTWGDYVDGLVAREGSLVAVAERLAATKSYEEDVGSIERGLRRLRTRGSNPGGKWGTRLLSLFGLPGGVQARLRWMAAYHSRFTDLPVPVCEDLVRLWDHPPTNDRRDSRVWLGLARTSIALRRSDFDRALELLEQIDRDFEHAPVEARIEVLLIRAFIASKRETDRVPELLGAVGPLLQEVPDGDERACLEVRWIDQRAYDLNSGLRGGPDHAAAEALYRAISSEGLPPFVLCRRANGLAYARFKQGDLEQAANLAREAAAHAGDGGHVRLRVMALGLLSRIDPRESGARARALEMSRRLDDELLLSRLVPSLP